MLAKKNRALGLIFLLAFFLIFWRLNYTDITGDDGHYSFRAVGLTDWLLSEAQTTPMQWFVSLPAWSYLSFHDHPLLLFIIQHLFFSILGVSTFVAKLPYALFGLGTIWFTYRWVKNYYTEKIALLSALLLSVSAGFIMLARRPLMETGVMFFLALSLYYLTLYLKDQKYWWKLGLALGILVQIKLTVLFIFPTILSYLCLQPTLRTNKKIWRQLGGILGIVFIFSLPTLVYELAMLNSRGHFSYQFARLLGQTSPWEAGGVTTNLWSGFSSLFTLLINSYSIPFIFISGLAVGYLMYQRKNQLILPAVGLFWLLMQDVLIGSKNMYTLFLPVLVAWFLQTISQSLAAHKQKIVTYATVGLSVYLCFYTLNSVVLLRSFGPVGWLRAQTTPTNFGIYQLDSYLTSILPAAIKNKEVDVLDVYPEEKLKHYFLRDFHQPDRILDEAENRMQNIIVYDSNLNWFARTWVFAKRLVYDNVIFISTQNLPELVKTLGYMPKISYVIMTGPGAFLDNATFAEKNAAILEAGLVGNGLTPEKIIYRDDGQEAFRIYHLKQKITFVFE